MSLDLALDRLQRWMQSVIVHPGDIDEALGSSDARRDVPPNQLAEVLLPSTTLTPAERLDVYKEMYPLRMAEALESDYPSLQHFLGDHGFAELVRGYIELHPSRSHSLNRLGDHLPDYVKDAT